MKKAIVSIIIIGAFSFYCFMYARAATPAIVPTSGSRSSSSSVTPTPATQIPGDTPTPTATNTQTATSGYKDGSFTGSVADAQWGVVQVQATIKNGKITQVQFLQYPNDRNRSISINSYADPQLSSEAIQAQSANVDIVTGATDSSDAFIQSLSDALTQAKA